MKFKNIIPMVQATQVWSWGQCGCRSGLENRKHYIRLLNSIYTPERIGCNMAIWVNLFDVI